ncbi:DUF397 domain-containing protein [Actinomadura oligospora]
MRPSNSTCVNLRTCRGWHDSKHQGPVLIVGRDEWVDLLGAVKLANAR